MSTVGLLLWSLAAQAATVPIPWREGVHIYTHPRGWRPAGVSPGNLAELEGIARALHTPVYVVLLQGETLPGSGAGQQRLQATTDELMATWGTQGLDLSRYSVFSVAWGADCDQPPGQRATETVCEYFLNTGSEYIHGPAHFLPSRDHAPITNEFRKRVSTTPQDPMRGIQAVMEAVDNRIWRAIDPVKVRARAERALQDAIAEARTVLERLSTAERTRLDQAIQVAMAVQERDDTEEMHQMARTLQEAHQKALTHAQTRMAARAKAQRMLEELSQAVAEEPDLPARVKTAALARSREATDQIEQGDTVEHYVAVARSIEPVLASTLTAASELRRTRKQSQRRQTLGLVGGAGLLSFATLGLGLRRRRRQDALEDFEAVSRARAEQITHAKARYMELELNERSELAALADTVGRTADAREAVQTELDAIYAGLQALQAALDRARLHARQAGALDLSALRSAIAAIDAPFDFDTGQLVNDQLFTGSTRIMRVEPSAFMQDLQERFQAAVHKRDRLRAAASIRFNHSVDLLPHSLFDELAAQAQAEGIPESWLSDHPLYGDATSDQDIWDALDEHRTRDPIRTLDLLGEYREVHQACEARLQTLSNALASMRREVTTAPPTHPPTVVARADDPAESHLRAAALQERALTMLALGDADDDIADLTAIFEQARHAFARAKRQAADIAVAVQTVAARHSDARSSHVRLARELQNVTLQVERASRVHRRATRGRTWIEAARRALDEADRLLATAARRTQDKRHLDSLRVIALAQQQLDQAAGDTRSVDRHLDALDRIKRQYDNAFAAMARTRQTAARKIASYGERAHLDEIPSDVLQHGPVDFSVELAKLKRLEESWGRAVRSARNAKRARDAHEAAARAAARLASQRSSSSGSASSAGGRGRFRSSGSSGGGGRFGGSGSSGGGGGW